jgi:ubiquitin carboxyl-terminal hydrolase L3
LDPDERAKLLETTDLFATAHAEAASGGQSAVPADLKTDEHFVAFVLAPDADPDSTDSEGKRLIELDGTRATPVDHGAATDLLRVSVDGSTTLAVSVTLSFLQLLLI